MKAKSLILTMMATLFICSSATAQSHIDKIVEELEQKGVDVSKVVKRNPKTKKVVSETKNLSFYSKDSKYANRLKEAFKKDAEDAIQETIYNHGNSHNLFFKDGTKSAHYNLSITPISGKDPLVKLSIIIRDGDNKGNDLPGWGARVIPLEGLEQLELNEKDLEELEKLGNHIEKWSVQFGKQMENFGKDFEQKMKKAKKEALHKADSIKMAKKAQAAAKAKRS